jgi:hypothetical protein
MKKPRDGPAGREDGFSAIPAESIEREKFVGKYLDFVYHLVSGARPEIGPVHRTFQQ